MVWKNASVYNAGDRFGHLTVISSKYTVRKGWRMRCDCGLEKWLTSSAVKALTERSVCTRTCPHACRAPVSPPLRTPSITYRIGQTVGKWTVLADEPIYHKRRFTWLCKCECGFVGSVGLVGISGKYGCASCAKATRSVVHRRFQTRKQVSLMKSEYQALFPKNTPSEPNGQR